MVRVALFNNSKDRVTLEITTVDNIGWFEMSPDLPADDPDRLLGTKAAGTWRVDLEAGRVYGFVSKAKAQFAGHASIAVVYANGKDPWPKPPPPPPTRFATDADYAKRCETFLLAAAVELTRRVRAILIGVPVTARAISAVPRAVPLVTAIETLLTARFGANAAITTLVPSGTPATEAAVLQAFDDLIPTLANDDLCVVLFAGHGVPATLAAPSQAWALAGTDTFTDIELTRQLLRLPSSIDTVIISACCYGEGAFTPGPIHNPLPPGLAIHHQLRIWNQRRVTLLTSAFAQKKASMVCISAAARDDLVMASVLPELATEITAAAEANETYDELEARFVANGFTGRAFQIDARPSARSHRIVLDPTRVIPVI